MWAMAFAYGYRCRPTPTQEVANDVDHIHVEDEARTLYALTADKCTCTSTKNVGLRRR